MLLCINMCILSSLSPGIGCVGAQDRRSVATLRCDKHFIDLCKLKKIVGVGKAPRYTSSSHPRAAEHRRYMLYYALNMIHVQGCISQDMVAVVTDAQEQRPGFHCAD